MDNYNEYYSSVDGELIAVEDIQSNILDGQTEYLESIKNSTEELPF